MFFRRRNNEVYTTIIWMLMTVTTYTKKVHKEETNVTEDIQEFVKPRNNSAALQLWMNQKSDKTGIDAVIKQKVKELKSLLEDDTVEDVLGNDQITLEGDDETTIIEFNPNVRSVKRDEETKALENKTKDFQENLQKYKKLRSKIRRALKRENVSNKTKSLVTMTLDKMIAQMIAHRCSWSNSIQYRGMMANGTNKNDLTNVIQSWYSQWSNLKHQFKAKKDRRDPVEEEMSKDKFLQRFQDLVTDMSYDLNAVAGKYKVVCRYEDVNKNAKNKTNIRSDDKKVKRYPAINIKDQKYLKVAAENAVINNNYEDMLPCAHFKICSEELTQFLLNFYITFNDTAVNVITNYAAMFLRDVSDDSYHEKERVVKLIMNIAKIAKKKVELIYTKQTKKLKLSKMKNRYENLKILYEYVAKTLERYKKIIHKEVETSLTSVRQKLMRIIQKDIYVNMALDLDNLERDVNAGICNIFDICNGVVYGTRKTNYLGDKNNVYVKVQVKLADEENNGKARIKINEIENPQGFGDTRMAPSMNNLVLKIEPSFNQNNDIVLRANPMIANETINEKYPNDNITSIIPRLGKLVLGIKSDGSNENLNKTKEGKSEDNVKVKIMFVEETKEEGETVAPKRNKKRITLNSFRKAERMRQLDLNANQNKTVTVNNITEDIKQNII